MRKWLVITALLIGGCGGGGGGAATSTTPPSTPTAIYHNVTISWVANREKGVNSTGGGYKISISGASSSQINVPYVSGLSAPTSTIVPLSAGSYTATITAYAALDAAGGTTGTVSVPSAPILITVP
jgi:hypothetical protein